MPEDKLIDRIMFGLAVCLFLCVAALILTDHYRPHTMDSAPVKTTIEGSGIFE